MDTKKKGFVRTKGTKIVDEDGKELFLKGVGIGNWLLPEGYMWKFTGSKADRPRRIEQLVEELIGEDAALDFWTRFRKSYIQEDDIQKIVEEGYNSIRLPINYRVLLSENGDYIEEGFQIIDNLLEWCYKYKLYVIFDLHGAPGGQTGANIDDSKNNIPELFEKEEYKAQTIQLWRAIADRYKNEWIVAGYDLLNEPLPVEWKEYHSKLVPLYKEITQAIREVDKEHMIIIEGAHWATDWSMFSDVYDGNLVLQFHKYWNNPDTESIEKFLKKREELGLPIWMGESGENNLEWFAGAFQLFEDHEIPWCFWPWKKMDTSNTPCSIKTPAGWDKIQKYVEGGVRPKEEEAREIFEEYLHNIALNQCEYHSDVVNAMMRRVPFKIPAEYYGYKGENISYHREKVRHNILDLRKGDGGLVQYAQERSLEDPNSLGLKMNEDVKNICVKLANAEWVVYEVNTTEDIRLEIMVSVTSEELDAAATLFLDNAEVDSNVTAVQGEWKTVCIPVKFLVKEGKHLLKLEASRGTILLDSVEFRVAE